VPDRAALDADRRAQRSLRQTGVATGEAYALLRRHVTVLGSF
jgi:hypothetical protein